MKGLEAKIPNEFLILEYFSFLNNKQHTLSIWSCLDWHCINLAHMTQESMVSQSPSWGVNVLASLSLWMWSQWYANSYCGFQGPCCVAAMIWSKIVFLLTLTLTLLPSITNVEPKRDYEHCHEIYIALDFSFRCSWFYHHIHTFELKK